MATLSDRNRDQLDALFAPWNRSDEPGLAVGVGLDGEPIYRRGFGMASLESGRAITPTTRMRIGSTTKHFTALAALLLAEERKLNLDVPIRHYLPEMQGPGGEPSIRQLLQHRGGSRCYLDLGFIGHGMVAGPKGYALAMQQRQKGRNFPPGTAVVYNNGGYQLVSAAIDRAAGMSFEAFVTDRLFAPLGMRDTLTLENDMRIVEGMATLHVATLDGRWRRGIFPYEDMRGDGCIVSTIDDMMRWTAHLAGRDRFASSESWAELTASPLLPDGSISRYALGLINDSYRGLRTLHHGGGVIGGVSQMILFPDHGLDINIMTNGAVGADPVTLAERVADILLEDALQSASAAPLAADYESLIGIWWSDETGMIYEMRDSDGMLRVAVCGSNMWPLIETDGNTLTASPGAVGDVRFAYPSDGSMTIGFGGVAARYHQLSPSTETAAAFAARSSGNFTCEDGDCVARFEAHHDLLIMKISDDIGSSDLSVSLHGDRAAIAKRAVGQLPFAAALSFDAADGLITRFRLSTSRTRNLEFVRDV
jgi:D-aminopeptidase